MSASSEVLTLRQQAFCRAVVSGASHTDAARTAGYSARTARSAASRLLTQGNIQAELARLRAAADVDATLTLAAAKQLVSRIAADESERSTTRLSAVETLARLSGWQSLALVTPEPAGQVQRVQIVFLDRNAGAADIAPALEPDTAAAAREPARLPAPEPAPAQPTAPATQAVRRPRLPAKAQPPATGKDSLSTVADAFTGSRRPAKWDLY